MRFLLAAACAACCRPVLLAAAGGRSVFIFVYLVPGRIQDDRQTFSLVLALHACTRFAPEPGAWYLDI